MEQTIQKYCDIEHCPVRNILSRFATKWGMLIIFVLDEAGTQRFSQFRKVLPDISPKVLASTLKILEEDGIIKRNQFPCVPPKVEYSITPLGKELASLLNPLATWAIKNAAVIQSHRKQC